VEQLEKLHARLQDIDSTLDGLLALSEWSEEHRQQHDTLQAERETVIKAIANEQDRLRREEERTKLQADREKLAREQEEREKNRRILPAVGNTRIAKPDLPKLPATAAIRKHRLANGCEVDERWLMDPSKGFMNHVDFLQAVVRSSLSGTTDARLKPLVRPAKDHDGTEELRGVDYLVPLAFTPARPRGAALYNSRGVQMTAGSDEQGTYSDPYGGFLVGKTFMPQLYTINPEVDPVSSLTRKIPMETPSVGIPARVDKNHTSSVSGGLRFYRRSETQTVSPSRMELEEVELKASALFGVSYITEELLSRSLISFLALLESGFSDELSAKLMTERLEGTGVGQFEGVLNTPCIITVDAETGQDADSIVYQNVVNMRSRCWRYGQAVWLANHDTLPTLMQMNFTVGTTGFPIWQPSAREDSPDMLLGRPIYFSEFLPTVGDAGDLLLGVWSEFLEGTLTPLQSMESIHVRFLEHERAFKFWTENAGRVWWRSALTPRKSTKTLAPFVKLAAR
jgi:HK97 family phage major capsid protein